MFNGRYNQELYEEYSQWLPYITEIYLPICDSETGDFRFLPFEGTILDQPYMTMQVIKLVQMNFRQHLHDRLEKMKNNSKSSGSRRPRY